MQADHDQQQNDAEGDGNNNSAMTMEFENENGTGNTHKEQHESNELSHTTTTTPTTTQATSHTRIDTISTLTNSSNATPQTYAMPSSSSLLYSEATRRYRMEHAASTTATPTLTNRIVIPTIQGECGMITPLPRINDASFRQKWNNRQLSINCAVLFDSVKEARHVEYLEALCHIIEPTDIVSIGNAGDGKISIVLISTKIAEKVLLHGITLRGTYLQPTPFMSRPIRVVLSKIPAWVPDEPILKYFKQFGKITSNIRPLPINNNRIEKFTNIISNFRELYINLDKNKKLPGHLQIIDGEDSFSVDVTTEQKCYVCRETGHLARVCPKKLVEQQPQEMLSTREFPELRSIVQQQQSNQQSHTQQKLSQSTCNDEQHNTTQKQQQQQEKQQDQQQQKQQELQLQPQQQQRQQPQPSVEPLELQAGEKQSTASSSAVYKEANEFSFPNPISKEKDAVVAKRAATKSSSPSDSPAKKILVDEVESLSDSASICDTDSVISDFEDDANLLKKITPDSMKKLLTETYHKRNKTKLKNIVMKYSKSPKQLLPDFKTYRTLVQANSPKPTNTLQRIDRLIEFVDSL